MAKQPRTMENKKDIVYYPAKSTKNFYYSYKSPIFILNMIDFIPSTTENPN